jgi:hypothetical protein
MSRLILRIGSQIYGWSKRSTVKNSNRHIFLEPLKSRRKMEGTTRFCILPCLKRRLVPALSCVYITFLPFSPSFLLFNHTQSYHCINSFAAVILILNIHLRYLVLPIIDTSTLTPEISLDHRRHCCTCSRKLLVHCPVSLLQSYSASSLLYWLYESCHLFDCSVSSRSISTH